MTSESIRIHMIKLPDHRVVDMFLFLKLYKNSLTDENIVNKISTEPVVFDLEAKYCLTTSMDRAVTNYKLLN